MPIGSNAIRAASAYVEWRAEGVKLVQQQMRRLESTVGDVASRITQIGAGLTAIGGAALAGITVAVNRAADLGESVSKAGVIFGESASQVEQFSKTSANAFGISRRAAFQYTSALGEILNKSGQTEAQSAATSVQLTKLAADLASISNIGVDEALEKDQGWPGWLKRTVTCCWHFPG